jgi:dihydroorotase
MKYDLLIAGGEVVDPGCRLAGKLDIGIKRGKIVEIAPALRQADARKTVDVAGKFVLPGLVDVHAHIFEESWNMGESTDRFCRASGVTTLCDAGSTGSANFAGLRHLVEQGVRTRAKAFVNLASIGIVASKRGGELSHAPYADPEGCAQTIIDNPDLAIGVKLRFSHGIVWENGTEPLRLARMAADMAEVPLMIHVTDSPLPLPEILTYMKPGDIVTHCLHGYPNGIMGPQKNFILKEVIDAQRNGIIFDCAHGRAGHFSFPLIEKALDQGFLPDTISTDLTFNSATRGPVFDLPTTMSKLLHFGVPLEDLVLRATANPAKILGVEAGALRLGAPADIAVLELAEGAFPLHDTDGNTVTATRRLIAAKTLKDGRVVYERSPEA